MNKRLKSIVCATVATCSLLVVQSSIKVGSIGVDAVSAATESAAPAPAATTPKTTTRSTSNYTSTSASSILVLGSKGDAVKSLQTSLDNNGYKLDVDGFFGNLTLQAVKDFQKQKGLVVDGVVGAKTLAALNSKTSTSATAIPTSILNIGSSGSDVTYLQTNLNKIGYKLDVDGIFGNLTLNAVKDFQKSTSLEVDGVAGPKTFAKLNEKVAAVATPTSKPPVDAVATASVVDNADAFQKAIAPNGKWIIAISKDVTTDKALRLDGQFTNGKKDANTGLKVIQRKIGLYTQNDKHVVTARFTLTAPSLTILSPNASIEHGNFKGDIYVSAPNFKLVNATIDGNVYFTNKAAKDTFTVADKTDDLKSVITGKQELKLNEDVDVVATASIVDSKDAFEKGISSTGKWITAVLDNLTFDKELVWDGDVKDTSNPPVLKRKMALYAHASDTAHTTTDRFILTAPKLTIKSPNASIQHGMFKGDVYVSAPGFSLTDAVIDGNVYFATAELKDSFKIKDNSFITGAQLLASDVGKIPIRIGRADYKAHGSGFAVPVVVMAGNKIAAVSMDEYQFMDAAKIAAPVPNTEKLSANYKDPTTRVLGSKLTNKAYYSENMKNEGKATQAWDVNMSGVIKFATGKTIAELDAAIKDNMNTDGTNKDPKVDAVTGATFVDTNGYLKAILQAANNAANADISYMIDSEQINSIKIGRADYKAHGSGFAVPVVAMVGDKIAAVSMDEYQFMDAAKIAAPVPNTEKLSANYKDPTTRVLGSKLINKAYYSENMKNEGKATQAWDVNMSGVIKFATGKTIAELDTAIKDNMNADGTNKDPKVDAVTGATFVDTNGYLKAILAAAKVVK